MKVPKTQKLRILAISLFSKYLGVAILKDTELVYWGIKKLREKGMTDAQAAKRAKKALSRLIGDYSPQVMIVGKPSLIQRRNSPRLRLLYKTVEELGKEKLQKVLSFSLAQGREFICQSEKPTKMNTERIIVTQYYPWLYRRYQKDLEKDLKGHWWERKYYTMLFDAVALGIYCYETLKRKAPS